MQYSKHLTRVEEAALAKLSSLHVYRNSRNAREICVTNGSHPPPDGRRTWHYWSSFNTPLHGKVAFDIDFPDVCREVLENGYALRQLARILRAR